MNVSKSTVYIASGIAGLSLLVALSALASGPSKSEYRASVQKSLPAISKTLAEYPNKVSCFSCHHQGAIGFALSVARGNGFAVDADIRKIVDLTNADLRHDVKMYTEGDGQPGGVSRAGYALFMLHSAGEKPSDLTLAVTNWMLKRDTQLGYWKGRSSRPPAEFSNFTDTFLAISALKNYGDPTRKTAIDARIAQAKDWLERTAPKETEDSVFRLWALKESGASETIIKTSAEDLIKAQLADGGWTQLPGGQSDVYATGTVMTVLRETGSIQPNDPAYIRGLEYLTKQQQPDGTWHVTTRSHPVQPYFESGFPYGKDQFISTAATGWAIAAMCLSK